MTDLDAHARRVERLRHELDDEGIWLPADRTSASCCSPSSTTPATRTPTRASPRATARCSPRRRRRQPASDRSSSSTSPTSRSTSSAASPTAGRRSSPASSAATTGWSASSARGSTSRRPSTWRSAPGALVVQRLGRGWVRLTTPDGVATWDGIHWSTKPLAVHIAERVAPHVAGADPTVLANLLELCTHWLGAGRVGATLVWRLDGDPRELGHLGLAAAVDIPPLDLTQRAHFAALLNALSQYDRAALVDAGGRVSTVGVHLRSSERSRREIAPVPRHPPHLGAALLRRRAVRRRVRRVVQRHAVGVLARPPAGDLSGSRHGATTPARRAAGGRAARPRAGPRRSRGPRTGTAGRPGSGRSSRRRRRWRRPCSWRPARRGLDDADRRGDLAGDDGRRHREADARLELVDAHGDALGDEGGGVGRVTLGVAEPGLRRRADAVDAERPPVVAIEVEGHEVPPVAQRHQAVRLDVAAAGAIVAGAVVEAQPDLAPAGLGEGHQDGDVGRLRRRPDRRARPGRCARSPRRACRRARAGRSA